MKLFQVIEEREINASAETVHRIITDYPAYNAWNPWITHAEVVGDFIMVKTKVYGLPATFRHALVANTPPTLFHWCDVGFFTRFVDGQRIRTIESLDANHCRYRCELRVTGAGTAFAALVFGSFMRAGMKAEADALQVHAPAH